jgi:type I restriction enzyme, S subunit
MKIPEGWRKVKFGEVTKKINDMFPNREDWTYDRYISGAHFDEGEIRIKKSAPIKGNEEVIGYQFKWRFQPGDLLYVVKNPRLRKAGIVDFEGICSISSFVIRTKGEDLIQSLLPFIMQTEDFTLHACNNCHGSTNPFLNWKDIAKYDFLLPTIDEQKNISKVLWSIEYSIKQLEELIKHNNKFKNILVRKLFREGIGHKKYKQTKRGKFPEEWLIGKFPDYVDFQEGPGIMAKDFTTLGVPLLRITNLKNKKINLEGCNFLSPQKVDEKWNHFKLKEKDILISCSASTEMSEVTKEAEGAIAYTGIIRLRPLDNLNRRFLKYYVESDEYINQINRMKTGSTIQHYGPTHLKKIFIPVPSMHEQKQIVNIFSKIFYDLETKSSNLYHLKNLRNKLSNELLSGNLRLEK